MDEVVISKEDIDIIEAMPPEQIEIGQKMFLYSMEQDEKTGAVRICPMNSDNCITIHGAEEAIFFINHLMGYFRTE